MNEGPFYDKNGTFLGQVKKSGEKYMLYGQSGEFLGQYDSTRNCTYDEQGGLLGHGNLLGMLIRGH